MSTKPAFASSETQNPRWWEGYLIRYLIGSIIGAICVLVVSYQIYSVSTIEMQALIKNYDYKNQSLTTCIFILSIFGFSYCYIASTPIAILHLGRSKKTIMDKYARYFWISWLITSVMTIFIEQPFNDLKIYFCTVIASAAAHIKVNISKANLDEITKKYVTKLANIAIGVAIITSIQSLFFLFFDLELSKNTKTLWTLGAPIAWIILGQYISLAQLLTNENESLLFYKNLFNSRKRTNTKDVRDTYTHLREYGNAIFIVAIELAALALIVAAINTKFQHGEFGSNEKSTQFILGTLTFIFIWITPGLFLWGRANVIESHFFIDNASPPKKRFYS